MASDDHTSSSADHHRPTLTPSPPSSSSSPPTHHDAAPPPPPSRRRVPPPCWSVEETLALIDSYQEKWYSLRRGNLRAHHWQEVADAVSLRCPSSSSSPKTALQCRHKIEKLRKRYRSEISRNPRRFTHPSSSPSSSSWLFFRKMHSMERGPSQPQLSSSSSDSLPANGSLFNSRPTPTRLRSTRPHPSPKPNPNTPFLYPAAAGNDDGDDDDDDEEEEEERATGLVEMRRRVERNKKKKRKDFGGVAQAIGALCEGFVRMEQMKMEMASEIHKLRMEMELKRTEMMLHSQRRIVDTFLEGLIASPSPPNKRLKLSP